MGNPAGRYQNKLFHPREKFCKKARALMSDEKERGELLVMRNSVWREERSSDFTDQLSAGVGRLTLHILTMNAMFLLGQLSRGQHYH